MILKNATKERNLSEAFSEFQVPKENLKVVTKDGHVRIANRDLLRFLSPLVNNIYKDVPCCTDSMVIIPDVCKVSVISVLEIIGSGITSDMDRGMSTDQQLQDIKETAKMLGVDLTNMQYTEKSKVEIPAFAKARTEKTPSAVDNELILQIKTEPSEVGDEEALLKVDTCTTEIKGEPLDQNVEMTDAAESWQVKEFVKFRPCVVAQTTTPPTPSPTPSPTLISTPTLTSDPESSKSRSRSPKSEQYLHRSKGSKVTKKTISEETLAALAKMMKDPKRKPTMEEMEELLSRANSFKDTVVKQAEVKKRDSPRSPECRSERSRRRSDSDS